MKEKFRRNTVDCSRIEKTRNGTNPTKILQTESHRLQKITDLDELKEEMSIIIEESSISDKNKAKFVQSRDKIKDLAEMQMYLYNYILAGSGMQTKFER